MNELNCIREWTSRVAEAQRTVHQLLAGHERSPSRVIVLEQLLGELSGLPVDVQDYFREAMSCLEYNHLRAATVMAWAGHFHVFSQTLYQTKEQEIRKARPKWSFKDLADLKDTVAEAQILDVGKAVGFINNAQLRVRQGQLSVRNQCAHPTLYRPSLNSAIGYVDELLRQTIEHLGK